MDTLGQDCYVMVLCGGCSKFAVRNVIGTL